MTTHLEAPFDPYEDTDTQPTTDTPQDTAAEMATLGAMLTSRKTDPDGNTTYPAIETVATILRPGDFWRPHNETIYSAIAQMHANGEPIDPITVAARIPPAELKKVGGAVYLHDLVANLPIAANADHYAEIVRDKARRRRHIAAAQKALNTARNGKDQDLDNLATSIYETVDAIVADQGPTTHTPTTWAPVDLEPVLAGEYLDPPPTMLTRVDGIALFYDHAVHTVSGESESGKTWLTLLAALQLAQTGENVVFLDFEDRADRVIGRLLALGATPQQIRDHFKYIRPDRPLDDNGRTQLSPHLTGTRLVILDGVTEAMTSHGFDLNSNADSASFQNLLPRWICDHGPAVAMIDHVVKDKERQDRFALGAQHKLAGIDGAAYIVKMLQPFGRGKRGLARVEIAKDRPGHVRGQAHGKTIAEFTLDATASDLVLIAHLMPPGEQSGRAGETFEPTILMEKISRAIQLTPGLSKNAIENLTNGKATTKRLALELLITRGYVDAQTGKNRAIQHFHVKSYYADPAKDPEAENSTEGAPE